MKRQAFSLILSIGFLGLGLFCNITKPEVDNAIILSAVLLLSAIVIVRD